MEELQWLVKLFDKLRVGDSILGKWRNNYLMPLFKDSGDVILEEIKFMSQTLMLCGRVTDSRLQGMVEIGRNQFGFILGRSNMELILAH